MFKNETEFALNAAPKHKEHYKSIRRNKPHACEENISFFI